MKSLSILYAGMKYDYGDPSRGLSFEHTNFYDTLVHMNHKVTYFDFVDIKKKIGKEAMNEKLEKTWKKLKPDLFFCFLFTDEFDPTLIDKISQSGTTLTFNWFADDHWRFDNYSQYWAPHFNWVSTTATSAVPKYAALGYKNVIKTQWACNHFLYQKKELPLTHDVTFIGQPHGNRRSVISHLTRNGIPVETWGHGWDNGRLSQDEMINMFNQSRINLNLGNSSNRGGLKGILFPHLRPKEQIKGRNFEVPGCGGFLLSSHADNLEEYYKLGKEIEVFHTAAEMVEKCRFYLDHETERKKIADAGYKRTVKDHTYEHRFNQIFKKMGLLL